MGTRRRPLIPYAPKSRPRLPVLLLVLQFLRTKVTPIRRRLRARGRRPNYDHSIYQCTQSAPDPAHNHSTHRHPQTRSARLQVPTGTKTQRRTMSQPMHEDSTRAGPKGGRGGARTVRREAHDVDRGGVPAERREVLDPRRARHSGGVCVRERGGRAQVRVHHPYLRSAISTHAPLPHHTAPPARTPDLAPPPAQR